MYPETDQLLSIRDGEPVDAKVRATVKSDPALQAEVERLQATRQRLRDLPGFEPPSGVRARVFEQLATDRETRGRLRPGRRIGTRGARATRRGSQSGHTADGRSRFKTEGRGYWALRGVVAAAVAVVAVLAVRSVDEPAIPGPGTIVGEDSGYTNGNAGLRLASAAYTPLTSESARLERLLNEIPYRPRLVNAGTATTITGLQDRIAQVDQVLMYSPVNGLLPEQTEALWQERVDLMNALLQVRYAEAQRFGF